MAGHVPSGMLRIPMTVQKSVRIVDAFGQADESWITVGTIWCHVEVANTTEVVDDLGPAVRTDWRMLATWHPSINTRCRLLWTNRGITRTFNIRACWDRDQRRRRLEIEATEVLS